MQILHKHTKTSRSPTASSGFCAELEQLWSWWFGSKRRAWFEDRGRRGNIEIHLAWDGVREPRGMYQCQRGYLRPKMGILFASLTALESMLLIRAELKTCKLGPPASAAAVWTLLFEQPYAVSDQAAHQTERCFGVLIINKDHCKNNGAKRASGWRDMQKMHHFPWRAPILGTGTRCVHIALSFLTQGDLTKSEHMLW